MVKEVVIFPSDLEKGIVAVERRIEAKFFRECPLGHEFTRPNDASARSVTKPAALCSLIRKLRNLKRGRVEPLLLRLMGGVERNPRYAVRPLTPVSVKCGLVRELGGQIKTALEDSCAIELPSP